MFERYTDKARRTIFFARYEASMFGSMSIEPAHLLLGLLREDQELISRLLPADITGEEVRAQVEAGTPKREELSMSAALPLSDETKRILAYAHAESDRLLHRHIGTEHLLLGLLHEEGSLAARVLRGKGLSLPATRQQIMGGTQVSENKAMYKTIGIMTGGGDAPGLNAVIRAAVKTAVGEYGVRVVGIEDSFEGCLGNMHVRDLTPAEVRGLLPRGGTILGTRNRGYFVKNEDGSSEEGRADSYQEAMENLRRLGIEALVVLGGEGTLGIAAEFDRRGFPVVGVPKTIDNDLACTELTFGFVTALDIATEALDRLHTTAESHDRVMILEVMGRHAGWIALHSGIAGGADVILIPEIPFSVEAVAQKILEREKSGSQFSIVVVAEGAKEVEHEAVYLDQGDRRNAPRLGGIGNHLRFELERRTGKETRAVVLGHLQRGGTPNAFDRLLATNFGACAVRALMSGEHGVMVALQASSVRTVPLSDAVIAMKLVEPDGQLVRTARDIGISFGAPDEAEHHASRK